MKGHQRFWRSVVTVMVVVVGLMAAAMIPVAQAGQRESESASPSATLERVREHVWRVERPLVAMGALNS